MKKILSTLALVATMSTASAQMVEHINNFQVNLGGGVHTYLQDPLAGQHNLGFGGLIEAQYQLMFTQHFGIAAGVQASTLAGNSVYNYRIQENGIMLPGAIYTADVENRLVNWRERQRGIDVSVPVQFIIRAPFSTKSAFQMGLGATINCPVQATYSAIDGASMRTAHMDRTNVDYTDMHNHLLGRFKADESGTLDLSPVSVGILADLGFVINLSRGTGLYLGVYGDYTPANVNRQADMTAALMAYDATAQTYTYQGTFASDRVHEVHPIEAGIKIGLRFGCGHEFGWREREAAEAAALAQAKADSIAAVQAAEAERLAAEERARQEAAARAKAEAEARAKAQADSIAAVHAAELARAKAEAQAQADAAAAAKAEAERLAAEKAQAEARAKAEADRLAAEKAEAEARAKAEAEARAKAEAEARAKARAEQRAREEAAFVAGFADTAYFETAKDMPIFGQLNEDSWTNLKEIMDSHPEIRVTVTGHTDNIGSESSNKALSQRRADNIKKMLVDKGIAESRITAIGKGESHPIASNNTPEGRAKNRCIIITIGK